MAHRPHSKRQANLVTSVQGAYDFRETKEAMEALTHDNEMQVQRLRFQRTLFITAMIVLILVVVLAGYFI